MSDDPNSQALWRELLGLLKNEFTARLKVYRPNLAKSTGVVPSNQLPTAGNTGSGYTPTAHAASHQHGGSDEVATAVAAANAIPKAGADAVLAPEWLFVKQSLAVSATLTVPTGYSLVIADHMTVEGTLIVNGDLAIV